MTAWNVSSTAIEVRWGEVPIDRRHGVILGYDVTFLEVRAWGQWKSEHRSFGSGCGFLNATVSGLGKFSTYCIIVTAFTSKGMGNTSKCVFETTEEEGKSTKKNNKDSHICITTLQCSRSTVILSYF